jgi:hypothetical protein
MSIHAILPLVHNDILGCDLLFKTAAVDLLRHMLILRQTECHANFSKES